MTDYFDISIRHESAEKQAMRRAVNRMEVTGEGITPASRALGKAAMIVMFLLLLLLLKDHAFVLCAIILVSRLAIALLMNQFRMRTHLFSYALTAAFLAYFAAAGYWTAFGLVALHALIASAHLLLILSAVRKLARMAASS